MDEQRLRQLVREEVKNAMNECRPKVVFRSSMTLLKVDESKMEEFFHELARLAAGTTEFS